MRHDIEEKLGIKAYDIYGLTEISGPGVAFECEEQSGMHINEDYFIAEVIDPKTGEVLPDGEKGELVFTSFAKEAFPLIRYRTKDICILSRKKCSSDTIEVRVEMTPEMFSDELSKVTAKEKELVSGLKSMLGIYANVRLVAPKSITRSEGKAVRVIDKRNLYKG